MGSLICLQFCYLPCGVYFHLQFSHIRFVSANILFTFLFSQIFGFISLCHPSSPSLFITLLLFVFFCLSPLICSNSYTWLSSLNVLFSFLNILFSFLNILFSHIWFYLPLPPLITPFVWLWRASVPRSPKIHRGNLLHTL